MLLLRHREAGNPMVDTVGAEGVSSIGSRRVLIINNTRDCGPIDYVPYCSGCRAFALLFLHDLFL